MYRKRPSHQRPTWFTTPEPRMQFLIHRGRVASVIRIDQESTSWTYLTPLEMLRHLHGFVTERRKWPTYLRTIFRDGHFIIIDAGEDERLVKQNAERWPDRYADLW